MIYAVKLDTITYVYYNRQNKKMQSEITIKLKTKGNVPGYKIE